MLRTFVGLHLRDLGGWIRVAGLLELLATAGVPTSSTRSAVSRLKDRGLLLSEKRDSLAGYRVDPAAATDLERGDRRIFSYRGQRDDEPWCLVSYSLPEVERSKRVQLRRALMGLGFGAVSDGLWIAPGHLRAEAEDAVDRLAAREHATIFITQTPRTAGPFARSAAAWWDLDRLALRHTVFLDRYEHHAIEASASDDRESFILWLRCVDDWKTIPYVDPGLPANALPADWPGMRSVDLFAELRARFSAPAHDYVAKVAAAD
nr:PaaX family transcriptional regulator C-terminal domain-containing protein [Brevibacterium marinum]